VHSPCLELMPDFQPTSEVTHLSSFLWSGMPPFTDHDFWLLSAGYRACPSSKNILLQCCWPNLCLGIQFHNSGSTDGQICYNGPYSHQLNLW
jgi:hypothetical protein